MDFATDRHRSEPENAKKGTIMKTFEKNPTLDNFLTAGLLAAGIAWVALAAAQAPATAQMARAIPAYVNATATGTVHAQGSGVGVSSATPSDGHDRVA
jgi:hypothetical protein